MRKTLLITGAAGMVGRELAAQASSSFDVVALTKSQLDVSDASRVTAAVARAKPSLVLHVGAWTNVDGCETDPDQAYRVNSLGTRNLAISAAAIEAPIVYVSTDYVFDGTGTKPYVEFDPVNPRSVYGRSKLAGEQFVRELARGRFWIVRSQWIYGHHGKNFVDTILAAARAGKPLSVVSDQIGCPTFARDLAGGILHLVGRDAGFGTYHCSANGECSWFEFTEEILRLANVTPHSLAKMTSDKLDRPAPRPAYSVLRNFCLEQTVGDPMRPWQDGVRDYLAQKGV